MQFERYTNLTGTTSVSISIKIRACNIISYTFRIDGILNRPESGTGTFRRFSYWAASIDSIQKKKSVILNLFRVGFLQSRIAWCCQVRRPKGENFSTLSLTRFTCAPSDFPVNEFRIRKIIKNDIFM